MTKPEKRTTTASKQPNPLPVGQPFEGGDPLRRGNV